MPKGDGSALHLVLTLILAVAGRMPLPVRAQERNESSTGRCSASGAGILSWLMIILLEIICEKVYQLND
jgi:hypothetical protein